MRSTRFVAILILANCIKSPGDPIVGTTLEVQIIPAADALVKVNLLRLRALSDERCKTDSATSQQTCAVSGKTCSLDTDCGRGSILVEQTVQAPAPSSVKVDNLPAIPVVVRVEGFTSDPKLGGVVLSWGQTGTLNMAVATTAIVILRPVERFSPVINTKDPTVERQLSTPRAGHTATLLDDGRVLIAGGFDTSGVSDAKNHPESWSYLSSAEIFDPKTGTIELSVPPMNKNGSETPRAFHTATKTAGGQVLMFGGEYSSQHVMQDQISTLFFDMSNGDAGDWLAQPLAVKRSRHASAVDKGGRVLFFGGLDWSTSPAPSYVQTFQWFDPATGTFGMNADPAPLYTGDSMTAIAIHDGSYVGIFGGSVLDTGNTGKLNRDSGVRFYDFENNKMVQHSTTALTLGTFPAAAGLGTRFVIAGGFTGFDPNKWWDIFPGSPTDDTEILDIANGRVQVVAGPSLTVKRGHMCAVTLNDGRMLFIGGRGGDSNIGSVGDTAIFTNDTTKDDPISGITVDNSASPLTQARYFHTCTLLQDGSVLVTGGINESDATFATLSSMEIFVPRPASD
jgi:hypothetical protein